MLTTEFLFTSMIVILIPGTGVIYTISNGLFLGSRTSVAAAVGCTLGIVPHLLASVLGLSFILHMSAQVFVWIKLAGALYLLYLAWMMWRDTGELTFDAAPSRSNLLQVAVKGIWINLLNPKLTIFFFAFLPLFLSPASQSPTKEMLLLSLVFMVLTLIVFVLYGLLASSVRSYVINSPRVILWLRRSFAAAFAYLGMTLALSDR